MYVYVYAYVVYMCMYMHRSFDKAYEVPHMLARRWEKTHAKDADALFWVTSGKDADAPSY